MNMNTIKRKILWLIITDPKKLTRKELISNITFFILVNISHLLILFCIGKIIPLFYFFAFVIIYLIIIFSIIYYLDKNKEKLRERYNLKYFSSS